MANIAPSKAREMLARVRANTRAQSERVSFYGAGIASAIGGGFLRAKGFYPSTIFGMNADLLTGGAGVLLGLTGMGGKQISNMAGAGGLVRLGIYLDGVGANLAVS